MFKILDIYIARKFLTSVFFILIMAAIVSTIFDVSEKTEDFIRNNLSLETIVFQYYIHFVPNIINLISPLLIFIAALYFTSRMASQAEIIAILSSGVSYYRLLVPYVVVAVMMAGGDLYIKNYLIPRAYNKVNIFEQKYVLQGYNFYDRNIHRQLDKNTYFYMQNFDYVNSVGYKFALEKYKDGKLVSKVQATEARYDTVAHVWRLRDLLIRRISGMKEELIQMDSTTMKLPITKAEFGQKVRNVPSMITPELNQFIAREKFKGETLINFYLIEKYKRTSLPYAIIVLVMIAVAIATRKVRGGIGTHLLLGILIAISYELSMRFSTTLSTNADFPPLLAVWTPNIIYTALAVILLVRTPK